MARLARQGLFGLRAAIRRPYMVELGQSCECGTGDTMLRRQCCAGCGAAIGAKQYYKAMSYTVACGRCGQRHGAKRGSRWAVALLIGSAPIVNLMLTEASDPQRGWHIPLMLLFLAAIYALLPWLLRIEREDALDLESTPSRNIVPEHSQREG